MAPVVRSLPSHVKDNILNFSRFQSPGRRQTYFHYGHYISLHRHPIGGGLPALEQFFDLRTIKEPSLETLLRLAELVLTLSCFSFAGNYFKEINGVAMGTKMGPNYANLFVGYIEHQFFNQYNGPKPELYRRYIDDCIRATSSTRENSINL